MEATTTLADALLDDLDDLNDSSDDEQQNETTETHDNNNEHHQNEDDRILNQPKVGSATAAASRFIDSKPLQHHLNIIREIVNPHSKDIDNNLKVAAAAAAVASSSTSTATRQKEREEENHQLVVKSNKYLASLGEEMGRAHGELAKTYKAKFPELEELLPNHINYKNAVRAIGNETDLTRVNDKLNEILSSNQIITISVAGSTTSGRQLTDAELQAVDTAANYMEELLVVQQQLMKFVENSMESLCPSICALIGSSIAARLLGLAGGLQELTKIPACNLQVLGQTKVNSESRAGMSGIAIKQHTGLLAECQLVQSVPSSHRKKALKVVAAKLALVGRYDFSNVDSGRKRSASIGLDYRNQLEEKFIKLLEPDKAPTRKALPKPDLEAKKRRGGRRMRRMKERFEETAMMKQANTRAFSTQQGEYGDDSMGITMGLLDTTDSGGAIRKVTEKRKMKQADTKKTRKRAMQMAQQAKNNDGLASSVVFTQATGGMELINPDANKQKVKAANEQWFKNNAGFQSALPKRGT